MRGWNPRQLLRLRFHLASTINVVAIFAAAGAAAGAGAGAGAVAAAGAGVGTRIPEVVIGAIGGAIGSTLLGPLIDLEGFRRSDLRRIARRAGSVASLALAVRIGGRSRRWQAEDWRAALAESPQPVRYGLGLLSAAMRMRLYDLGGLLVRTACWILAADLRTWGLLGPIMAAGIINVHVEQGWGSAFFTIPAVVSVYFGVEWLRRRWGVVKHRSRVDVPEE